MKSLITCWIVSMSLSLSAFAGEQFTALDWESSNTNVAQVSAHLEIGNRKDFNAQIVSVYRGGIAQPFGVFLTIWDPTPQDGGDFGTMKTFDLGNYAETPKLLKASYKKIKHEYDLIEIELQISKWDPNTEKTTKSVLKLRNTVSGGEASRFLYSE